ncbi:MAG: ATP-dependent DNA helicase RecG [Coleofasciculaceae cyanobacterium SM2_1_6]|nr:ATP-dependent DNA helicase RecG [Coleofasciculaceae cyanobacterium SM2_1_6]
MEWQRLQKALSVEAEKGFPDLQGNQYRFSEFITLTLGKTPRGLNPIDHKRWMSIAEDFSHYPRLSLIQRQHLVTETKRFLTQVEYQLNPDNVDNLEAIVESDSNFRTDSITNSNTSFPISIKPTTNPRTTGISTAKTQTTTKAALKVTTPKSAAYPNIPQLHQALSEIPSIGQKKSQDLAKLGLYTVRDLLYYYPRSHIDYSKQVKINQLIEGETVTLVGTVKRCSCFSSPKNKKLTILEIIIKDVTGQLKISRFFAGNRYGSSGWQHQQMRRYSEGTIIAACGLVKRGKYGITLENPELEVLAAAGATIESLKIGRLLPVYPLAEGVGADVVRLAVVAVLPATQKMLDRLPETIRIQLDLIPAPQALNQLHFPDSAADLAAARRRLIFDEFFYLQLGFLQRRSKLITTETSAILSPQGYLIDSFYKLLPFSLTKAQQRVIGEIIGDLEKSTPMNRLVQGDVGAGKTVVAVVAILAAIQSGYQAALMAPTEVLAEQHYRKLVSWFNLLHLPVELLTGSTKIAKRRKIHGELATGEIPLLVGTHALIQDKVNFHKLGLVVIDEQHRFGVGQRARLQQKGESPHVLTMTATPIPRTLALTMHGDLDVSQIDELPPGRQEIQTTVLGSKDRQQAYDLIRREVAQGRQVYIVLPLVEESEKLDLRSAIEEHQHLSEKIFPQFSVGLLHGRMTSADKDEVLTKFRDNQVQIIVSTTVIEVGVDVPNATVMLIENAERFGLSQLHQLRGRVGRGSQQSYCLLMSSSQADTAKQRLSVLAQSQDGFFISEMDLRFRGPGEVLGSRQSGLADFALASLVEDQDVLLLAREAAEKIMLADPSLASLPLVKQELDDRYQKLMGGAILT